MPSTGASYDEIPYESHAVANTQPDRLATLATLFGLDAVPPDRARVLELGCAAGGNLLPLAFRYPDTQFVGIDLSEVQIEEGRRDASALGLRNLELVRRNLTEVNSSLGSFDYIIAHGIYSWIPAPEQKSLLAICAANLSSKGVAYVSYNTLPGWRMRGAIREMMRFHVAQIADASQRANQARALIQFLGTSLAGDASAYSGMLREELDSLRDVPNYHLLHDYLEDENEPLYFHQFFERASTAGLQYLCDEEIATSLPDLLFKPDVLATLKRISPDLVRAEQYSDFLCNRGFRRSILIGPGRTPVRSISADIVTGLFFDSHARTEGGKVDLQSAAVLRFSGGGGGVLATPNPVTKAAMEVLRRQWPDSIAFEQLFERANAELGRVNSKGAPESGPERALLASDLLRAFSAGVVGMHCRPGAARNKISARPEAFAPARYYAGKGRAKLPNARHDLVTLDSLALNLVEVLDGTRNNAELVDEIARRVADGKLNVQKAGVAALGKDEAKKSIAGALPAALARLRDYAFLVR